MQIPPPAPRKYQKRIARAWREMQPGESLLVSEAVAPSLRGYITRRGWPVAQRREGNKVRVWRVS